MPRFFERAISNPEPKTGEDHEKRDLAAQEASAVFSFWMVLIAGFGTLVTLIGTILLYQQIILTRQAVEDTRLATEAMREANEISRENSRPWLIIERIENPMIEMVTYTSGVVEPEINTTITLKNAGFLPASHILLTYCFHSSREISAIFHIATEPTERPFSAVQFIDPIMPNQTSEIALRWVGQTEEEIRGKQDWFVLSIRVDYGLDGKFDKQTSQEWIVSGSNENGRNNPLPRDAFTRVGGFIAAIKLSSTHILS